MIDKNTSEGVLILREVDAAGDLHLMYAWPFKCIYIEDVLLNGVPVADNKFDGLVECTVFNDGISGAEKFNPKCCQGHMLGLISHPEVMDMVSVYLIIKHSDQFNREPSVLAVIKDGGDK